MKITQLDLILTDLWNDKWNASSLEELFSIFYIPCVKKFTKLHIIIFTSLVQHSKLNLITYVNLMSQKRDYLYGFANLRNTLFLHSETNIFFFFKNKYKTKFVGVKICISNVTCLAHQLILIPVGNSCQQNISLMSKAENKCVWLRLHVRVQYFLSLCFGCYKLFHRFPFHFLILISGKNIRIVMLFLCYIRSILYIYTL